MKEIVIKIPDEVKQAFDNAENNELKCGFYDHGGVVASAIKNGTELPKGHGRLIDADNIPVDTFFDEWDIPNAKTLIEADKEYEVEVVTHGNCVMCGKELTEGLFFCKECESKGK